LQQDRENDVRVKLTQKRAEAEVRKHTGGPVWLYDEDMPGFVLVIRRTAAGALRATFLLRYGGRGRMRTYTLGRYGELDVATAREKAQAKLGDFRNGRDPVEERKTSRQVKTFRQWSALYVEDVKLRKRGWKEDVRHLAKADAAFGHKPLTKLTPEDIERVFQTVAVKHKTDANRFRASVSACLQSAWRLGIVPANVVLRTRPLPEPPPRSRILSEAELAAVLLAVAALPDIYARAVLVILLATGCRRSEALRARWADMNLDQGVWRIPRAKSGRSEVIPLAAPLVTMLRALPRKGALVIPGCGADPDKPRYDLKRPWSDVCEAAGLAEVTGEGPARKVRPLVRLHDLRRSVGAAVARRHGLHVASKLLRHSDIRVTERHYAPLGLEVIREAAEAESAKLAAVLPMLPAKVGA
jgi:integrase